MADTTTVNTTATTVDSTVDTNPAANTVKSTDRKESEAERKAKRSAMESVLDDHAQARELNNGYADLGFVYGSGAPIANAFGFEAGVVTRDEKTNTVQRTGFGFYLRSDHLCNQKFDGPVKLV